MKASELRIGNWVIHKDETIEVNSIGEYGINIELSGGDVGAHITYDSFDELKPIPLTEEWLLKFGFNVSKSYDGNKIYGSREDFNSLADYGTQQIVIEFNHHSKEWYSYLECGYYTNTIDCQHVHQLQNLYFALTGKELTIKEITV